MAQIDTKLYSDHYAYDFHKRILSRGEMYDADVINQSIELILGTSYGERLFNPFFGSEFANLLFESLSETNAEELLDRIISSIELWEDRVIIIRDKVHMVIYSRENAITLDIPYVIKESGIKSSFTKKIIF